MTSSSSTTSSLSSTLPPSHSHTYEGAISALLSPLHQACTAEEIQRASLRRGSTVSDMRTYLHRIRLPHSYNQNNNSSDGTTRGHCPNILHITGTKGKGSTASFCENILRHKYNLHTGLFTSPHLVDARERIRLDGLPVSKEEFGKAYWTVRERLETFHKDGRRVEEKGEEEGDDDDLPVLPGYFRMLTLMALFVFAHHTFHDTNKPIHVMILEVGMGGRYDATNIFDHSTTNTVCGVTLIDYDHTRVLGKTLKRIAWEKGGIFLVNKAAAETGGGGDKGGGGVVITPRPAEDDLDDDDCDIDHGVRNNDNGAAIIPLVGGSASSLPHHHHHDCSSVLTPSTQAKVTPPKRPANAIARFFTINTNRPSVITVLRQCATNEGNGEKLHISHVGQKIHPQWNIGLPGDHQRINAELAVHMCEALAIRMRTQSHREGEPPATMCLPTEGECKEEMTENSEKDDDMLQYALQHTFWPGRCQTVHVPLPNTKTDKFMRVCMNLRCDGAHTTQSLAACLTWFRSVSGYNDDTVQDGRIHTTEKKKKRKRILIFNCSHERNPIPLLKMILTGVYPESTTGQTVGETTGNSKNAKCNDYLTSDGRTELKTYEPLFDDVYFCPADSERPSMIVKSSAEELLREAGIRDMSAEERNTCGIPPMTWQDTLSCIWKTLERRCYEKIDPQLRPAATVFHNLGVKDAIEKIKKDTMSSATDMMMEKEGGDYRLTNELCAEVCVTGSLYTVGSALNAVGWAEDTAKGKLDI